MSKPPGKIATSSTTPLMGGVNDHPIQLVTSTRGARGARYGRRQQRVIDDRGVARAGDEIRRWPDYAPTPLRGLPGLAGAVDIGRIDIKDEGQRFGLGSFKPLGGAYAVSRVIADQVQRQTGKRPAPGALLGARHRGIAATVTVCAATDGNHGRAIAWGAGQLGCRAVIFIHHTVTEARARAIAALGAEVRRVPGTFDDAVRAAAASARDQGWVVVPDTAVGGERAAPRNVMRGYALMADETIAQLGAHAPPTHLFLQAGVGGMAAATCARWWQRFGTARPVSVLVEPARAACWFASIAAGRPTAVGGDLDSMMAGLACGEPSPLAWEILEYGADAAMTITDAAAADTMRLLANAEHGDAPMVAGESGVAGLAAALAAAADPGARERLGLGPESHILVYCTEGATDPESYRRIVGRDPDAVRGLTAAPTASRP